MKSYKIAVDLLKLKYLHTGLGQVMIHYGKELARLNNPSFQFYFLVPKKYVGYFGDQVSYITPTFFKRHFSFLNKGFDLWHATHQDIAFLPPKSTPLLLTIHDLNFLFDKTPRKKARRKRRLQGIINRSCALTAISEYTKKDVEANFNLNNKHFEVISNGVSMPTEMPKKPDFVTTNPFLLSIGVFKQTKNYEVLLPMMRDLPEFSLIMAGDSNTKYGNFIKSKNQLNNIFIPGKVEDSERRWLLENCQALLFPSTHEGMGLPTIEAMMFGKPVFASKQSCMPEICGDAAYYFPSFDPQEMAEVVRRGLTEFYADPLNSQRNKDHAAKFSWEKYMEKYLVVFKKILSV